MLGINCHPLAWLPIKGAALFLPQHLEAGSELAVDLGLPKCKPDRAGD